jgi:hypothetical protein
MKALAGAWLFASWGCGGGSSPPLEIELGTGRPGVFTLIQDDDTVELVRGSQGSQHIWVSLRATGLSGHRARVLLVCADGDGREIAATHDVARDFAPVLGAPYEQLDGLRLVVPNPPEVIGKSIRLSARVRNGTSETEKARTVTVQWGPAER